MPEYDATPLALHAWLRAATAGLCDEAKAFLYPSIEAHFSGIVAAALIQGKPRPDAEAAALAAMGSTRAARAQLQRTFLTPPEAERFRKMLLALRTPLETGPAILRTMTYTGLFLLCCGLLDVFRQIQPFTVLLLGGCIMLAYIGLRRHLARLWPERRPLRFVLLVRGLMKGALLFGFVVFFCKTVKVSDLFYLLIAYIYFRNSLRPWQRFRLWLAILAKLGRNPRLAEDFEPPPEHVAPLLKGLVDHA